LTNQKELGIVGADMGLLRQGVSDALGVARVPVNRAEALLKCGMDVQGLQRLPETDARFLGDDLTCGLNRADRLLYRIAVVRVGAVSQALERRLDVEGDGTEFAPATCRIFDRRDLLIRRDWH
jgi:hypothetical protein